MVAFRHLVLVFAVLLGGCEGSSRLLGPGAPQGIEGVVLLGPMCPVASEEDPCPDQPYQARIDVLGPHRHLLGSTESGPDGRFSIGLEPGLYILRPKSGTPFPQAGEVEVEVRPGVYASVTIHFDTGIR